MGKRHPIFVDGGLHFNCICIADKTGVHIKKYNEKRTSNELEHVAIYEGVKYIKRNYKKTPCTILSDSKLAVEQINGNWNTVNPILEGLANRTRKNLPKDIMIKWVPRHKNLAGIYLDYCMEHWSK